MRATKIIATIGPASESPKMLKSLAQAGVNAFRLNFSHDTGRVQKRRITAIRHLPGRYAVIADIQGPKHRIGDFRGDSATLKPGALFVFDNSPKLGDNSRVEIPDNAVLNSLKIGDKILLNDGNQELAVVKAQKNKITARVIRGGEIKSRRGLNLPDTEINAEILTEKDKADLTYAVRQNIDYAAISFVQRAADIDYVRDFINSKTAKPIKIIAKIERPLALRHIDEIIQAADAVMVARGDLAVETPFYELPKITRRIIAKCQELNRPVIVATQMLESMTDSAFPTRAEISDTATTAYLMADSAMTSEETSIGKYPAEAIKTMRQILESADNDANSPSRALRVPRSGGVVGSDYDSRFSESIANLAELNQAVCIVVFTKTGTNARLIAARHPNVPIVAVCANEIVANQLCLHRGVVPICDKKLFRTQDYDNAAAEAGINTGAAVVVSGNKIQLARI